MSSTIDEISPQLVAPAITAAIAEADQQLHSLAAPKHELFSYAENPPTVVWQAAARSKKRVKEGGRSLLAYLSLPPSQYSVLDARQIERISVDEFRCCPGALNFFGHHVSPVLYLRVRVDEGAGRVSIDCTGVELEGSPAIRSASNSFTCECTNIVSSGPLEPSGKRMLQSEVDLRIEVKIPRENWIPLRVLRSTGSFVLQRGFDLFVPQFVGYLARDYKRWSTGDDVRAPVVTAADSNGSSNGSSSNVIDDTAAFS